jgi:hypothetical protein
VAWLAWRGQHARWRVVVTLWVGAVFGTYAFYYHTSEAWWYLRFVLPAMPALVVAGLAGAQGLAAYATRRSSPSLRVVITVACMAVSVAGGLSILRDLSVAQEYRQLKNGELVYREAARLVEIRGSDQRPAIVGQLSGAVKYYAPRIPLLRIDRIHDAEWRAIRAWQAQRDQPVAAALTGEEALPLMHPEEGPLSCDWRPTGRFRWVTFWECPPP